MLLPVPPLPEMQNNSHSEEFLSLFRTTFQTLSRSVLFPNEARSVFKINSFQPKEKRKLVRGKEDLGWLSWYRPRTTFPMPHCGHHCPLPTQLAMPQCTSRGGSRNGFALPWLCGTWEPGVSSFRSTEGSSGTTALQADSPCLGIRTYCFSPFLSFLEGTPPKLTALGASPPALSCTTLFFFFFYHYGHENPQRKMLCLCFPKELMGSFKGPGTVVHSYNPSTRRLRQKDGEFEGSA